MNADDEMCDFRDHLTTQTRIRRPCVVAILPPEQDTEKRGDPMVLSQSPAGLDSDDPKDDPKTEASLVDRSRELAERVARPTTNSRDSNHRWDPDLFTELAATRHGPGLAGPLVPRDLGGGGLSGTETCALLEGLGEGSRDPGLALAITAHAVLATVPLRAFGTPGQREHY
ncbi:acyl-CoA dehydrogenase family protein, partial [Streptomyces lushanensis]|uniref:acyl-CoA dehydrogenase family protein n=1 Tax=Streptomyces lushanensis TaxID=1434255 RepID=UPI00114D00EB